LPNITLVISTLSFHSQQEKKKKDWQKSLEFFLGLQDDISFDELIVFDFWSLRSTLLKWVYWIQCILYLDLILIQIPSWFCLYRMKSFFSFFLIRNPNITKIFYYTKGVTILVDFATLFSSPLLDFHDALFLMSPAHLLGSWGFMSIRKGDVIEFLSIVAYFSTFQAHTNLLCFLSVKLSFFLLLPFFPSSMVYPVVWSLMYHKFIMKTSIIKII